MGSYDFNMMRLTLQSVIGGSISWPTTVNGTYLPRNVLVRVTKNVNKYYCNEVVAN
jgi:hypothetical protein